MAVPVRQSTSAAASSGSTSSLPCNAPAGVVSGNLLILQLGVSTVSITITTPTGWNKVTEISDAPTDRAKTAVYWRTADGTADDTPTISFSGNCACEAFISRITGHYASAPIEGYGSSYDNDASVLVASGSSLTADCLLFLCFVIDSGTVTGEPSGWSVVGTGGPVAIWKIYTQNKTAAGAYGGQTITMFGQVVGQEGTSNIVIVIASQAGGDPDIVADLMGQSFGL